MSIKALQACPVKRIATYFKRLALKARIDTLEGSQGFRMRFGSKTGSSTNRQKVGSH